MLLRNYTIRNSLIPGAGLGLFAAEHISRGDVVVAPTHPDDMSSRQYVELFSSKHPDQLEPETRDVRLINHSFTPTGHWHLGFVFACHDIKPGTELTVDYRLLGAVGCLPFIDGFTGKLVEAFDETEALEKSLKRLREITGEVPMQPALDG